MTYWQHERPLDCPAGHMMHWLGGKFWVCCDCHKVYAEMDT